MSRLPTRLPERGPDTAAFWAAAAEGRLSLPRCDACGLVIWYPRPFCPSCHGMAVTWIDAAGTGTVYSYTVCRRGLGDYAEATPYALAYVELDEGPRLLTNIVDTDLDRLHIGQRVEAVFDPSGPDTALVRFRESTS